MAARPGPPSRGPNGHGLTVSSSAHFVPNLGRTCSPGPFHSQYRPGFIRLRPQGDAFGQILAMVKQRVVLH